MIRHRKSGMDLQWIIDVPLDEPHLDDVVRSFSCLIQHYAFDCD